MKAFGFLSFGHYARDGRRGLSGRDALHQAIELSVAADDLGVNGAYFRVHHCAPGGFPYTASFCGCSTDGTY